MTIKITPQDLDFVGICDALRKAEGRTLPKRTLYRYRRRLERTRVGRWHFEYDRLKTAGTIIESGKGVPGDPVMVRLADGIE